MFILLDKLFLIFDKEDLFVDNDNDDAVGNHKYFIVFDLKKDSKQYTTVQWPCITQSSKNKSSKNESINEKVSFNCGAFSSSNDFLTLTDNHKNMVIFDRYFKPFCQVQLKKNAIKLLFNKNEDKIFICDKSGDIYECAFKCGKNPELKLLLGHCSMLLDFTVSANENFIISADRDEKIRITHYPNTYNIANYCLGHTEFVSAVQLINEKTLISGSGDGRLKIWDYSNGKILYTFDCESSSPEKRSESTSFPMKIDNGGGDETKNNKITKIRSKFAIKSINLDQKNDGHHHLCVSFYLQPLVYLFKIICENGSFLSFELLNTLKLQNIPTFICFDKSHVNFLWIFQLNNEENGRMVELYEFKPNTNELTKALVSINIIDALNQNEHLKQTVSKIKNENFSILETLCKPSYENHDFQYNQGKKSRIDSDMPFKKMKQTE